MDLLVKIAIPAMSLQFSNDVFGQAFSVSDPAVPLDILDRTHPGNNRGHCRMAQDETQGRFGKLIERDADGLQKLAAMSEHLLLLGEAIDRVAATAVVPDAGGRRPIDDESVRYRLGRSVARMEALGIDSTPTFLVGLTPAPGQPMKVVKVIKGALPFAEFKTALDAVLQ